MTTVAEIRQLAGAGAGEAHRVVWMPSSTLAAREGLDSLAREVAALVNRDGGRIVLGVTAAGQFEEQLAVDRQHAESAIAEIVATRVSPPVDFVIEHLRDELGEAVVVRLQRRTGDPLSAPAAGSGGAPAVFVRVRDRTRTASPEQIAWMRRVHGDPAVEWAALVRIPAEGLLPRIGNGPPIATVYRELLGLVPEAAAAALAGESDQRAAAYAELAPWATLRALDGTFAADDDIREVALEGLAIPGRRSAFAAVPGGVATLLGRPLPGGMWARLMRRAAPEPAFRLPSRCDPHVDLLSHRRKGRVMLSHPAWVTTFSATPASSNEQVASSAADDEVRLHVQMSCSLVFPERPEVITQQRRADEIVTEIEKAWGAVGA